MSKHVAIHGDAWIREAEESSRLIENLENRITDKNSEQRLGDNVRWKLLELGPKLDRLESLLHNPPAKPILTDHDLDLRRNMLVEIQQRTRAVALNLYALQNTKSSGSLPSLDTEESAKNISSCGKDHVTVVVSKQEHELLAPLVQTDDSTRSQLQRKQPSSITLRRWICRACVIVILILVAVAFVLILAIVCAVI